MIFDQYLLKVLHRLYSGNDPPPVDLIRMPQFLELLIEALFKPGSKINQVSRFRLVFCQDSSYCQNTKRINS